MRVLSILILAAVAVGIFLSFLLAIRQLKNPCSGCRGDCAHCNKNMSKRMKKKP